eukprot:46371_1
MSEKELSFTHTNVDGVLSIGNHNTNNNIVTTNQRHFQSLVCGFKAPRHSFLQLLVDYIDHSTYLDVLILIHRLGHKFQLNYIHIYKQLQKETQFQVENRNLIRNWIKENDNNSSSQKQKIGVSPKLFFESQKEIKQKLIDFLKISMYQAGEIEECEDLSDRRIEIIIKRFGELLPTNWNTIEFCVSLIINHHKEIKWIYFMYYYGV